MKIALGSDHAGFAYKEKIKVMLLAMGHDVKDFGTFTPDMVDYPLFIRPAAEAVANGACDRGVGKQDRCARHPASRGKLTTDPAGNDENALRSVSSAFYDEIVTLCEIGE